MLKQKTLCGKTSASKSVPAIATVGGEGFKVVSDYRSHRGLTFSPALRGGIFVPRQSSREDWEFIPETQTFEMDGKYILFPFNK